MSDALRHPRDIITAFMERIYGYGMTTTSGGNLSIKDGEGNIWITPGAVDKGTLTRNDIMCVRPDGTILGRHKPSSEFPFHKAVYDCRPDVKAVLHAHPPALVSFSIVRKVPDTRVLPNTRYVCGEVGYAPYAIPGSQQLGQNIATIFARGFDTVLLENHGVVTAGDSLSQAFKRFETLDFCARLTIQANAIGTPRPLTQEQLDFANGYRPTLAEFTPEFHTSEEIDLRIRMIQLIKRSYNKMLFNSTEGTFSVRVGPHSFLITPYGIDRQEMTVDDLVLIHYGKREAGKRPSRSARMHEAIYAAHADLNCVMVAQPPSVMSFAVTGVPFDTRTIPESYILLRDVAVLPFGSQYQDHTVLSKVLSNSSPLAIIENECVVSVGGNLLQAFDRLEVAEYSAKALTAARALGTLCPISEGQTADLRKAFNLT